MKTLNSIEAIHKVYNTTGSSPVLVTCNDLNEWVCKYDRSSISLFNEYVAASFLQLWGLKVPEFAFVTIHPHHIPEKILSGRTQGWLFEKGCFGSCLSPYALDLNETFKAFKGKTYDLSKIDNKEEFLKIGLFDLWLANEDRHPNNYNLLLNPEPDGSLSFVPIDHVACFNGGNMDKELYLLNEVETILNSPLAKVLFRPGTDLNKTVDKLTEELYICSARCHEKLPEILAKLPITWGLDKDRLEHDIQQIFSEKWLTQVAEIFRHYIQTGIR